MILEINPDVVQQNVPCIETVRRQIKELRITVGNVFWGFPRCFHSDSSEDRRTMKEETQGEGNMYNKLVDARISILRIEGGGGSECENLKKLRMSYMDGAGSGIVIAAGKLMARSPCVCVRCVRAGRMVDRRLRLLRPQMRSGYLP